MSQLDASFEKACNEITHNLLLADSPSKSYVRSEIKKICAKYALGRIPKNYEILSKASGDDYVKLQTVLLRKPVKTASGVAIVALMPKPYACPHGRCSYCPGGVEFNTPNSYTGSEPSTLGAIQSNYEPKAQITTKIDKLIAYGHDPTKLELVIVGGTFLFMPERYRVDFIKSCYDALNGFESETLEDAKSANEHAEIRNVGLTIETKPDYCKTEHVNDMLEYGVTRVEIGVQSLRERVYEIVNRGHDFGDVVKSFRISKDSGYKIAAHMMPGLPTVTPKEDVEDFRRLFEDPLLKPDMLKIYPSLVLEGTPMYDDYKSGDYRPYSQEDMIQVLTDVKKMVPRWVRIMRVQREISSGEIVAGPKLGNLRQMVHKNLRREGKSCRCIRCREAGLSNERATSPPEITMNRTDYESSGGEEVFLSYDDPDDRIYGFLRLRRPSPQAHRDEITGRSTIVRELHVYGKPLKLGKRGRGSIQHSGLGKSLMGRAERISMEEFDANKMLVISAVGTREYYRKIGYSLEGPYMAKKLG